VKVIIGGKWDEEETKKIKKN